MFKGMNGRRNNDKKLALAALAAFGLAACGENSPDNQVTANVDPSSLNGRLVTTGEQQARDRVAELEQELREVRAQGAPATTGGAPEAQSPEDARVEITPSTEVAKVFIFPSLRQGQVVQVLLMDSSTGGVSGSFCETTRCGYHFDHFRERLGNVSYGGFAFEVTVGEGGRVSIPASVTSGETTLRVNGETFASIVFQDPSNQNSLRYLDLQFASNSGSTFFPDGRERTITDEELNRTR